MKTAGHTINPILACILLAGLSLLICCNTSSARGLFDPVPKPPMAKQIPHQITLHGKTLTDPFFWLREKENPEVRKYIDAENRYTDRIMKDTEKLQRQLFKEMVSRIKEEDSTVPARNGPYLYYRRYEKGKQYEIRCRKLPAGNAEEEILLDENLEAGGHDFFYIAAFEPAPDHRLIAYTADTTGSESYTLNILDTMTGKKLPDRIENLSEEVVWANDSRTLFYVIRDQAERPYRVYRHITGTDPSKDELVYEEKDKAFSVAVTKSLSGSFIFIETGSSTSSEIYYLDANKPFGRFKLFAARRPGVEYDIIHQGDSFFILTNEDALNFKVMRCPVRDTSRSKWTTFIPHDPSVKIDDIYGFKDFLVVLERRNGLQGIRYFDMKSWNYKSRTIPAAKTISFEEQSYTVWAGENYEYNTPIFRFKYTSLVTPVSVYDLDMNTGSRILMKQDEVPGYNPSLYITERVHATAPDGVKIPISLVYRKGLKKNGKNYCFLQGYGAYGLTSDPIFSECIISLLERGFIYALAHIRGGGEMGRQWYEDGKLLKKKNTFTDFIASAEYLISQKYTCPERLAIWGGSAGGLLIGAVLNMRPELFGAAILNVPFVDAINTQLDTSLPLVVGEWEEWGNPYEREAFEYILSYSPYDNIGNKKYPPILVEGGWNDSRVMYWEPAKYVAKMRHMKKDRNLLLLRMYMEEGHSGSSGRYDYFKETAFEYAFIFKVFGIKR